MTILGTDIEQIVRNAIAEILGDMRYEMWFGDHAGIEVTESCVRVYAVNTFAVNWVEKNYMSAIFNKCRHFFETPCRIEIVSSEDDNLPLLKTSQKNGKSANELVSFEAKDQLVAVSHAQSAALPQYSSNGSSASHDVEICHAGPCEKQVLLPIQKLSDEIGKTKKSTQNNKTSQRTEPNGGAADHTDFFEALASAGNQSRSKRATTCRRLTPREINERIIANGKEQSVDMPSNHHSRQPIKCSPAAGIAPVGRGMPVDQNAFVDQNTLVSRSAIAAQTVEKTEMPGQRYFVGLETVNGGSVSKNKHVGRSPGKPTPTKPASIKPTSKAPTLAEKSSQNQAPTLHRDAANRNVVVPMVAAKGKRSSGTGAAATLGQFVIGPSNKLAVRTAELAVNHSGQISPIYIFGPTSVGKTHLLELIRAGLRRNPQSKPPVLMTSEQFTSAFIDGLKQGTPLFRNKFRGISALLVDDIQFFGGKESTQTEFLRTIDQLKGQGVQIVLTGDRPLSALVDLLKPEIVSRIEAGMHCEIKPAEHETLLAIFKQMAAARNLKLSDAVCEQVVSRLTTHARQLSGAVNRLHAAVLSNGRAITLESVEAILEDMIRNNRRPVRLQDIDKAVCETLQLGGQLLQSNSRAKQATQPRMLAMWLARKYTRSALSEIGRYFGNRSHSTVVSAQKKVDQWLQETSEFDLAGSSMPIADVIQKVERMLQTR